MHPSRLFLPAAMLAAAIPAQTSLVVSPSGLANAPGNGNQFVSAGTGTRWQQVHGDLLGPARLLLLRAHLIGVYQPRQLFFEAVSGGPAVTVVATTAAATHC